MQLSNKISRYVDDILRSTPSDVEQVVVEPGGRWAKPKDTDTTTNNTTTGGFSPATDDHDELIEIRGFSPVPMKQEQPATNQVLQRTPVHSWATPGTSSPANHSSTNKRAAAQVIDLTGSDDEDDSPVRPAKRPALNGLNRNLLSEDSNDSVSRRRYPFFIPTSTGHSSHANGYDT